MATINSTIKMNDKASQALQKVQNNVSGIEAKARKLNNSYSITATKQDQINYKIESIVKTQKSLTTEINKSSQSTAAGIKNVEKMKAEYDKLEKSKNSLIDKSDIYNIKLTGIETELDIIEKTMSNIANESNDINLEKSNWSLTEFNQGLEIAKKLISSIKSAMDFSDTLTMNTARLNLVNDGLQSTEELNQLIFQSANASRGSYIDMADQVAKLGLLAGDAFSSNAETTAFSEIMNKAYTVSGTSESAKSSANYQLTQALGAGALMGDELNSIKEAAPLVYEAIATYMGVSKAELKDLGSEGAITADVIKNAMFAASDEINQMYEEMPITFAQAGTLIENAWANSMNKMASKMAEAFNSEGMQKALAGVITAVTMVSNAISGVVSFVIDYWSIFAGILTTASLILLGQVIPALWAQVPALWANVTALWAKVAAWAALNWQLITIAAIVGLIVIAFTTTSNVIRGLAIALTVAVTAIYLFNSGLYACPIVWIIIAIFALIATLFIFAEVTGGVIGIVLAIFYNLLAGVGNICVAMYNIFDALVQNIVIAFGNGLASVETFFYKMAGSAVLAVAEIAKSLNKLPFVNFDYSGLADTATSFAIKAAESEQSKQDYVDFGEAWESGMNTFEYKNLEDAYNKGAEVAGTIKNELLGLVDGMVGDATASDAGYGSSSNFEEYLNNEDSLPVEVTGGTLDEVNISDEDLQFLKDVAEKDYQMNYKQITPNVNIEFGDIKETADVNQIKDAINKMMEEELTELYVYEGG